MNIEDLDRILQIQHPKLLKNIQILDKESLGQDYILRIDKQKMDKKGFVPMIAYRQANSEDRTFPRVVGAATLLGCLKAYPNIVQEYDYYTPGDKEYGKLGYYIHAINFEYCIKPNNKLVYDSEKTGELWLPRYNDNTNIYYPKVIGKVFLKSYTAQAIVNNSYHQITSEFYIEILKEDGIKFNNKLYLDKGYHSIISNTTTANLNSTRDIMHKTITKDEFLNSKKLNSTLESMPNFFKW